MVNGFGGRGLARLGAAAASHQVLLQSWAELFSPDSLDTYQVRATNSRTRLDELYRVAVLVQRGVAAPQNIAPLCDEALSLLLRDPIAQRLQAGPVEVAGRQGLGQPRRAGSRLLRHRSREHRDGPQHCVAPSGSAPPGDRQAPSPCR